jgi:hypothetical protein
MLYEKNISTFEIHKFVKFLSRYSSLGFNTVRNVGIGISHVLASKSRQD